MHKKDSDCTDQELIDCKFFINSFCDKFEKAFGRKKFTNYFHLLVSNHIYDYMEQWGNLSRYSQQDWEVLCSVIKFFFFRRTSKSGGENNNRRSKFKLLARLMQR